MLLQALLVCCHLDARKVLVLLWEMVQTGIDPASLAASQERAEEEGASTCRVLADQGSGFFSGPLYRRAEGKVHLWTAWSLPW